MDTTHQPSDKPTLLKSDTRQWTSGRVKFSVIGWKERPEENYVLFEKNFFGKQNRPDQRFILRNRDWNNLKRLIDGDFQKYTEWERMVPTVDPSALTGLIDANPDLFEKVLCNPNILKLSEASLEALDRIGMKLYEVKAGRIDLIFKEISKASGEDLSRFGSLLEDLRLDQVSTMASLVYQKLKVIDLLETTCSNVKNLERDVHDIFDKNPWLIGSAYEIVQSDRPLSKYLAENGPFDPELKKRPDLILKTVPTTQDVVLVELKKPGVPLKPEHIAQILRYKGLIKNNKPNVKNISCYVFGHDKDQSFTHSKDVDMKTFSELISELRAEYREYLKIIEIGRQVDAEE